MKAELKAKPFVYDLTYGETTTRISEGVIVLENGARLDGKLIDVPVYAEDENGKVLNFDSVDDAQAWIDKHRGNLTLHIQHGDELHATPNEYWVENLEEENA